MLRERSWVSRTASASLAWLVPPTTSKHAPRKVCTLSSAAKTRTCRYGNGEFMANYVSYPMGKAGMNQVWRLSLATLPTGSGQCGWSFAGAQFRFPMLVCGGCLLTCVASVRRLLDRIRRDRGHAVLPADLGHEHRESV